MIASCNTAWMRPASAKTPIYASGNYAQALISEVAGGSRRPAAGDSPAQPLGECAACAGSDPGLFIIRSIGKPPERTDRQTSTAARQRKTMLSTVV
jgi:hypothetical protein